MARSDPHAGGPTGSEVRQRNVDVRFRLTQSEAEALDRAVASQGFSGQSARGDWIRWRLGLLHPPVSSSKKTVGPRFPISGGQQLVAALADVGKQIRQVAALTNTGPAVAGASVQNQIEAVLLGAEAAIAAVLAAAARNDK